MNRLGSFHGRIEDLTEEATGLRSPMPLFDRFTKPAAPFAPASETSFQAAVKAVSKSEQQRRVILAAIVRSGASGCTRQELESLTPYPADSIRPRVLELIDRGLIYESKAQTRKTRAGNDAAVLLAVKA